MNKKVNVYLMYLIVFLQGFVFYGPIATLYRQARGLSMYEIFLIESIFGILMIAFEIPWGWFADRIGYKRTLIFSNLMFFISKIIFYKASSFRVFLIERVLLALVLSGISGCDIALLYSSADESESEKIFGRYSAFSIGGFLIASFISSIIVKQSMDKTAFWTIIPYGIAAVVTLFIKDVDAHLKEKPKLKESLKTVFSNKEIVIFIFSIALIREVVQAVNVFLNQLQYLRSGIDIKYFGIVMAIIQIVRLSSAKAYKLSSKLGKNRSIEVLYIIIVISCSLLIVTTNPIFSILFITFIAGSMALINPIVLEIQNKSINTGDRATILSIYAIIGDIVAVSINPLIGKAADVSVETAFKICVIICICAYALLFFYKRKSKKVE
ncbi:MFS transporter [Clostridium ganghwense]|uniref:MFS transporter n=1 Tax=Clostridium ganghwense TaxID=312089 RepID=A0ABT4CUM3_9CLOT|nr:MFS transporter [Clostridium ganghwense]MCY6371654.1 MFS transporter [Clostridium ganghwense]